MTTTQDESLRKQKHAVALQKIMQPEIARYTAQDIENFKNQFYHMRSGFSAWCARNQMFYTLALLAACEIEMRADMPSLAAVTATNRLAIMFHPMVIELWNRNTDDGYFLFVHELRHLVQAKDIRGVEALVDLEPIREVFLDKQTAATTQKAKDQWQKLIDAISDPTNQNWKSKRHTIANITMDAALHRDVLKLFPKSEARINEFLRETYMPYAQGFSWETMAKDAQTAKRSPQILVDFLKSAGPIKTAAYEALLDANSGIMDYKILAEVMKMGVHIQTIATVEDGCRNLPDYQPTFAKDAEWLNLADEYVKWLAKQIDENTDANAPPQQGNSGSPGAPGQGGGDPGEGGGDPGEGEGEGDAFDRLMGDLEELDAHDLGGDGSDPQKREEAERRIRDALRRAEEEGRLMEHHAGVGAGDRALIGDSTTQLNSKIKAALEKIRIKFVRLFSESNITKNTFNHINRLFSDLSYIPGRMKETKPRPQVVLVMDTSGSCYNPQFMNQMLSVARKLHKEDKLAALYYCDTELHKAEFSAGKKEMNVIGGGGTELSVGTCLEIQEREGLRKGWELVYITDEYCNGLAEARQDNRWKIHVINIEKLLGKDRG